MKLGYIGLGKMGYNMTKRLLVKGNEVVVFNKTSDPVKKLEKEGAIGSESIEDFISKLDTPRLIWIMVPYTAVDEVISNLEPYLNEGDVLVDGGNSPYLKTVERSNYLKEKGITLLDVGVSGGPNGALNGASLMIGGSPDIYNKYIKLFEDLSCPSGFGYVGKSGAGHFTKMVHNGVEYGMMQSIAEGITLLKEQKDFNIPLQEVLKIYSNGSVIESHLIKLLHEEFSQNGENLDSVSGVVDQSGEGLWMIETAKRLKVPVKVIEESVNFRLNSKDKPSYTGKVLSILRKKFGGHNVNI